MDIILLIKGIVIGVFASIPTGPVCILCIQRTLSMNQKAGFVSGLGAASADTLFATIALFSLHVVLTFIEAHLAVIKGIGGLSIVLVGVYIFMKNPVLQIRRNRSGETNLWQDYISMFFITLANPTLILVFVALFAAFGVSGFSAGDAPHGFVMLAGVLVGCSAWWFLLTFIVNTFRKNIRPRHLLWMNRISGAVICLLGVLAIVLSFINTPLNGIIY